MTRDKQKAKTATMVKALHQAAISALESYEQWAPAASEADCITPVQFFAVVLWASAALQNRVISESDELVIVAKWWGALVKATALRAAQLGGHGPSRVVYPIDELTQMQLDTAKVSAPTGWYMRISEVDEWLFKVGAAAWCAWFLESCGLRGKVIELGTITTTAAVASTAGHKSGTTARCRVSGTAWTEDQKAQLAQDFKDSKEKNAAAKHAALAKLWSIQAGSVKKQLAAIINRNKKAGTFGSMAATLTATK